ncbi:MAG: methyltransferase domain-containing protein [Nitrospiraceae bacterium]|nr:methyltransferase domain-containing protein [Nitrospiraceae bacterium]
MTEPPRKWSDYYEDSHSLAEIHRHLTNMAPFIAKVVEHFPEGRLLEIGTGTGILTTYFSQIGYQVAGLDLDRQIVAANRVQDERFGGKAAYVIGDMFTLPFAPDTFGACYHQGLLEHFDPPQIVDALRAQTAVCGKVIFAVPTAQWRGETRGDERMWPGNQWLDLLSDFHVLDVFGMSYSSLFTRAANLAGRHATNYRPARAYHSLALRKAGQIGFVITRR